MYKEGAVQRMKLKISIQIKINQELSLFRNIVLNPICHICTNALNTDWTLQEKYLKSSYPYKDKRTMKNVYRQFVLLPKHYQSIIDGHTLKVG